MSPTSYQAAPPRDEVRIIGGARPRCQRTAGTRPSTVRLDGRTRGGRARGSRGSRASRRPGLSSRWGGPSRRGSLARWSDACGRSGAGPRRKEEDDLSRACEPQLLAGNRLDAERIGIERLDVGGERVVLDLKAGDLRLQLRGGAALADAGQDAHVAEQEVQQEHAGDDPEAGAGGAPPGDRVDGAQAFE